MRFSLLFVIVLLLCSCHKEKDKQRMDGTVDGKWLAVDQYQSNGAAGRWVSLSTAAKFWINFSKDGELSYSSNFPQSDSLFNRYTFIGSNPGIVSGVILPYSTQNAKKDIWNSLGSSHDTLTIAIFRCFEGCAYRFVPAD